LNHSEKEPEITFKRGPLWYLEWVFACYAAAFGLFMLISVITIPFMGNAFVDWWFEQSGSLTMFAVAIAASPFIYRRLR
jgi:hypothetical protein